MPFAALLMKPAVILFILLMLSMAGNAGLWKMFKHELTRVGQVEAERDEAIAAGARCTAGVAALKKASDAKAKTLEARLRAEIAKKQKVEVQVIETLSTKPADPANLCASAEKLTDDKLKARREASPKPIATLIEGHAAPEEHAL
jgi:hypothetical protein